ncbi:nSTAND1 domain-containing NTPase [Lentzea sp. NPDC054927]
MTALFLSHASRDQDAARLVRRWLGDAGYQAVFLDFDPTAGIPLGRKWEVELYGQLRQADGVVFLASTTSVESKWCFAELSLARSMGRPVFPLRLEPGAELSLLQDVQWIDLEDGTGALDRLLDGLRRAGLRPDDAFAWDPARPPFPGLEPFERQDAAVFFGREREVDRLVELLSNAPLRRPGRFVMIAGPSGSGKSSLLRAGLLPRLERSIGRWKILPLMQPGRHPLRSLARSLQAALRAAGQQHDLENLVRHLDDGAERLVEFAQELGEAVGEGRSDVLLVIDQAEELVTRSGSREQEQFLALVREALHEDSPLWIVGTMRAEFLSDAPERAGLAAAVDHTILLEPLSRAQLPAVIQRPAQRAGVDFSPGLVQRMVEDTTGGDALPLLAWTLQQLYHRAGRDRLVTTESYEAVGGVIGSLQRQADRLTEELHRREQGHLVLPTLLKLVNVDEAGEPTRRRVGRRGLSAAENSVVQLFVDARLLTSNRIGAEDLVEVAHEALLRQWPPLSQAIIDEQDGLRMRSEVERLANDWDRGGHDESYLLRGNRLAVFREWARQHAHDIGAVDRRFLDACVEVADREAAAAEERGRFARRIQAESWARASLSELSRAPEQAVLLALAALVTDGDEQTPEVIQSVHAALDEVRLRHVLREHADRLSAIAFSPDGRTVLTGSYDGTGRLWDLRDGTPERILVGHDGPVVCVAWSPDGTRVATGSWDGTARIWDPASGVGLAVLTGHDNWVSAVNWSPDGRQLATASQDNTAGIWDVAGGLLSRRLRGHTEWVRSVEWHPDGRRVLTGSYDGTAALWDARTGRRLSVLRGHTDAVPAVRWLPDGRSAVTASEDGTIRLWNVGEAHHLRTIAVHTSPTYCLDLDPSGGRVVTGSEDGIVRVFDLDSGQLEFTSPGHRSWVSSVRWSPDGEWIASCSGDGTARLTHLPGRRRFSTVDQRGGWISSIRWRADGSRAAWASGDGTVCVRAFADYEVADAEGTLMADMGVLCLDWHPDGMLLATGGFQGEVRVVDAVEPAFIGSFPQHRDRVTDNCWHPDGTMFATSSYDGTVLVTALDTGVVIASIEHDVPLDAVAWNNTGELLAVGDWDGKVHLWRMGSDQALVKLDGHTAGVHSLAWAPTGEQLVSTSGDGSARIWNTSEESQIAKLLAGEAFAVGWSPSGRLVATGSRDGVIRVWDAATGALVQELRHSEAVHALDWSPDGEHVLSGGEHGLVTLWHVGIDCLRRELTELAGNVLSDAEIRRLVPEWPNLWSTGSEVEVRAQDQPGP